MSAGRGGRYFRRAVPLLALGGLLAVFVGMRLDRHLSFARLIESRDLLQSAVAQHPWAALGTFTALLTSFAALAIPGGLILTLTGGFLFGGVLGGAASAAAVTAGGTLLFLAARGILHEFLASRAGGIVGRMRLGFQRDAWSYMLFLRFTPLVPFWLVTLGAALAGVRLPIFVAATALGILPATFVVAFAGQNLDRLISAGRASFEACRADGGSDCAIRLPIGEVLSPGTLLLLLGASFLALTPALTRAWRASRRVPPPGAP